MLPRVTIRDTNQPKRTDEPSGVQLRRTLDVGVARTEVATHTLVRAQLNRIVQQSRASVSGWKISTVDGRRQASAWWLIGSNTCRVVGTKHECDRAALKSLLTRLTLV